MKKRVARVSPQDLYIGPERRTRAFTGMSSQNTGQRLTALSPIQPVPFGISRHHLSYRCHTVVQRSSLSPEQLPTSALLYSTRNGDGDLLPEPSMIKDGSLRAIPACSHPVARRIPFPLHTLRRRRHQKHIRPVTEGTWSRTNRPRNKPLSTLR